MNMIIKNYNGKNPSATSHKTKPKNNHSIFHNQSYLIPISFNKNRGNSQNQTQIYTV